MCLAVCRTAIKDTTACSLKGNRWRHGHRPSPVYRRVSDSSEMDTGFRDGDGVRFWQRVLESPPRLAPLSRRCASAPLSVCATRIVRKVLSRRETTRSGEGQDKTLMLRAGCAPALTSDAACCYQSAARTTLQCACAATHQSAAARSGSLRARARRRLTYDASVHPLGHGSICACARHARQQRAEHSRLKSSSCVDYSEAQPAEALLLIDR